MALLPGARLGVYEVVALIGAGGMGAVYRARDTRLNRDVALKILPEPFVADAERIARFEREAQVLASLNHPNIAHIHGLEDASGTRALVLEFVEGQTLADRIERGAIPVEDTLAIASQIANALEAAHASGIIHRDLKPANIKLRSDGTVKVLDFGLAKALADQPAGSSASISPTITSPALMTGGGVILGTAAYMSPEQARGKPADKRSDIWAFGCVVYEMLTGRRAFDGEEVSDTLAAILRAEPDWGALPAGTPVPLRRLLRRCLEKDRKKRLADIADAQLELEDTLARDHEPGAVAASAPVRRDRRWLGVTVAFGALTAATAWALLPRSESGAMRPLRASIVAQAIAPAMLDQVALAISPDGSRLVYRGDEDGAPALFIRQLDGLVDTVVRGSEGGDTPFFSPDGQWIGFFADEQLKKVPVAGGTAIVICKVTGVGRGATWAQDGTIIFATGGTAGLWKVSADGHEATPFTTPQRKNVEFTSGSSGHKLPSILPGDEWVVFVESVQGQFDDGRILARSIRTGEEREVFRGGSAPRYSPTGHLIVARAGSLWAMPFDLKGVRVTGPAVEVLTGVYTRAQNGVAHYDFTRNGLLISSPVSDDENQLATVSWLDRNGDSVEIPELRNSISNAKLSPDAANLALSIQGDIWVFEFDRRILRRLTLSPIREGNPTWTSDGRRVAYTSNNSRILWKPIDGSADEEVLVEGGAPGNFPTAWTPDGKALLFRRGTGALFNDLWLLPLDGSRTPKPYIASRFNEGRAAISPDGNLVAYESNESGRDEIYVRPFDGGSTLQVSTGGAAVPTWSANGLELFFQTDAGLTGVSIVPGSNLRVSPPRVLFDASAGVLAGVSSDGKRFLMIKRDMQRAAFTFNVVVGWFEELRRKTRNN